MEDKQIIELYWNRDENAIIETQKKYDKYCGFIAYNILRNIEEMQECVNDSYLKTWNSIPPKKPNILKLFLAKITRNLAINKFELNKAQKRYNEVNIIIEELDECAIDKNELDKEIESSELVRDLNQFLKALPKNKRDIFLERYWYAFSIKEIASQKGIQENNVKVILYRLRKELKEFLKEKGVIL